jgi:hypothetical protein
MEATSHKREAWNKGKLVGQKPPLKPKEILAVRIHLQNSHAVRDLALFNFAIDSKLRGCDLVNLHVRDVTHGNQLSLGRWSFSARRSAPSSSNSRSQPVQRCLPGSRRPIYVVISTSSRAGLPIYPMFQRVSTQGSCIIGWKL